MLIAPICWIFLEISVKKYLPFSYTRRMQLLSSKLSVLALGHAECSFPLDFLSSKHHLEAGHTWWTDDCLLGKRFVILSSYAFVYDLLWMNSSDNRLKQNRSYWVWVLISNVVGESYGLCTLKLDSNSQLCRRWIAFDRTAEQSCANLENSGVSPQFKWMCEEWRPRKCWLGMGLTLVSLLFWSAHNPMLSTTRHSLHLLTTNLQISLLSTFFENNFRETSSRYKASSTAYRAPFLTVSWCHNLVRIISLMMSFTRSTTTMATAPQLPIPEFFETTVVLFGTPILAADGRTDMRKQWLTEDHGITSWKSCGKVAYCLPNRIHRPAGYPLKVIVLVDSEFNHQRTLSNLQTIIRKISEHPTLQVWVCEQELIEARTSCTVLGVDDSTLSHFLVMRLWHENNNIWRMLKDGSKDFVTEEKIETSLAVGHFMGWAGHDIGPWANIGR